MRISDWSSDVCSSDLPVVLSEALAPFAPLPFVTKQGDSFRLIEEESAGEDHPQTFGRMTAFHGQMGMFTRALTYILSHGADGLKQVAEDAVLNANYVLRSLEDVLDARTEEHTSELQSLM